MSLGIRISSMKFDLLDGNSKSLMKTQNPDFMVKVVVDQDVRRLCCAMLCCDVLCCAVLCRLCSENSATLSFLPPSPLPWWRSWFLRFDFRLRSYTSPTCGLSQVRLPRRTVRNPPPFVPSFFPSHPSLRHVATTTRDSAPFDRRALVALPPPGSSAGASTKNRRISTQNDCESKIR